MIGREAIIGAIIGVAAFLVYLGFDITPLILFAAFGLGLYIITKKRGLLKLDSHQKIVANKKFKFEDIGGLEVAKQELKEALEFLLEAEKINKMGIRPLKGILLTGPPGTGKTLLARAAAGYSDAVFLTASGSEFIEMYAGVGAQRVRSLFKSAREMAKKQKRDKAIIFIDEIEVLGGKRGSNSSHLEYDQTLNQLLVEMDGLTNERETQVLLIAATNRADLLDPALLRPGRFDRQVRVDLPDKEGRLAILKLHAKNKPLADDTRLEEIAGGTYGFSGAHLESLMNEAAILALRDENLMIQQAHLTEAIDKVIMGEKLDHQANQETLRRVAVHEAGHAVVSEVLEPESVEQITVTSRGDALGYVRHSQSEDTKLLTKSSLENKIIILLAGAVSEELFLGEKSTGAINDFQKAMDLAERIINAGLSRLGIASKGNLPEKEFHHVCREIMQNLEFKAEEILTGKRDVHERIVKELITREKLNGPELRQLLETSQDKAAMSA